VTGIALVLSEIPEALIDTHGLAERVYDRGGQREVQFHWWQEPTVLPVRWDGRLQVLRWGSKSRRGRLPCGGCVSVDQFEAGALSGGRPEPVVVPANLGHHKGTWFLITAGIRGVVLPDVPGGPVVYLLVEPSTNYYRNMTEQSPLMPVLVDQVI
jgi:hypothetical protein